MSYGIRIRRYFVGCKENGIECYWQIRLRWRWRGWDYERCFYPAKAKFSEAEANSYEAETQYVRAIIPECKSIEDLKVVWSNLKYHA